MQFNALKNLPGDFFVVSLQIKGIIMSEAEMNRYRLTSMEEPGDERLEQLMREVADEARESTRRAAERVAAGIDAALEEGRVKWGERIERIRNGNK